MEAVLGGGGEGEGRGLPAAAGLHTTDGMSATKQTSKYTFDFRDSPWLLSLSGDRITGVFYTNMLTG